MANLDLCKTENRRKQSLCFLRMKFLSYAAKTLRSLSVFHSQSITSLDPAAIGQMSITRTERKEK